MVELDVIPAVGEVERLLLARALDASGGDAEPAEARLTSQWWRAGVQEAVDGSEELEPD